MEALNSKKFKTLEKEELKNVMGGLQQPTTQSIWTYGYDEVPSHWDDSVSEDAPSGPIYT
ncbi:bacteriocin-like protein [Mucilaginibacter oryzae]|uniref:Bacteriocin-like protein n=1 Tax=Mucilaginibacter oryzae TaxID=468058 RepID=A0A316HGC4_9SPHI|nr:bacteriocin [Mucilaginibacter oryzae]PWK77285.1 bacteriocin-like protein [Mucilaginibacter oryzae]